MSDLAPGVVAAKQAQTLHSAQLLMVKKQHEMDAALIDMLAQAIESAPAPAPAGMGAVVDKRA